MFFRRNVWAHCFIATITLMPCAQTAADEQETLLDFLASGYRLVLEESSSLQKCFTTDRTLDALVTEINRDIANLDTERSQRRLKFATKSYANHPQLALIQSELDLQAFRFNAALDAIDGVMLQCPLDKRLHLRKSAIFIAMGLLDQAATELRNPALQLLMPDNIAYMKGLIAYHRGDFSEVRHELRKIKTPGVLEPRVQSLARGVNLALPQPAPLANRAQEIAISKLGARIGNEVVRRPSTPFEHLSALLEAVRANEPGLVSAKVTDFSEAYPDLALVPLFAYYSFFEIEDFQGAQKQLARFEVLAPDYPLLSLLRGRLARAQARFGHAIEDYERQIALTPGYRWPYEELFDTYLEAGRYNELIALEGRYSEEIPTNYRQLVRTAKAYRNLGRHSDALIWYEKAISLEPKISLAYRGKGTTLISLSRWDDARVSYEEALEIDPSSGEGLVGIAKVLSHQEKYSEAKEYAEEALRLWPNSLLVNVEYAVVSYKYGDTETAQKTCDGLTTKVAMGYSQQQDLAYCYEFTGSEDRALTLYRKLYQQDPQPLILDRIGRIQQRQGRLEEARASLKRAVAEDGGSDMSLRLTYSNILYEVSAWPEMEEQYRELAPFMEHSPEFWSTYGTVQRRQKDFTSALISYRKSLALNPDSFDPVYGMALSFEALGRQKEAELWFVNLIDVTDRELKSRTVIANYFVVQENYSAVLEHAEAGLEHTKNDIQLLLFAADAAHNLEKHQLKVKYAMPLMGTGRELARHISWVAIHIAGQGKLSEAETLFLKAVAMEPENQYYLNSLGYSYYLSEKLTEALETFERALSMPAAINGLIHYNTGLVYLKRMDRNNAQAAFQRAKEAGYPPLS